VIAPAADLRDALRVRERHIADDGQRRRRDRLEQAGDSLIVVMLLEAAMPPRNSRTGVERMMV